MARIVAEKKPRMIKSTPGGKKVPANKDVCYTYLKKVNTRYLKKLSADYGQTISACLDAVIDAQRIGRELKLPKKQPKYVSRAKEWREKNRAMKRSL